MFSERNREVRSVTSRERVQKLIAIADFELRKIEILYRNMDWALYLVLGAWYFVLNRESVKSTKYKVLSTKF